MLVALAPAGGGGVKIPPAPRSNKPKSLPRKYLASNEFLLFESQPTFNPLSSAGGIALIFLLALDLIAALILTVLPGLRPGGMLPAAVWIGVPVFISIVIVLGIILTKYSYSKVHYAMTDQRIILVTGIFGKSAVSVEHRFVTAVQVSQSFLMGRFGLGRIEFSAPSFSQRLVVWHSIRDPQETSAYIMDIQHALEYYRQRGQSLTQAAMIGNAVAANIAPVKQCWNCKASIADTAAFCRNCGSQQP